MSRVEFKMVKTTVHVDDTIVKPGKIYDEKTYEEIRRRQHGGELHGRLLYLGLQFLNKTPFRGTSLARDFEHDKVRIEENLANAGRLSVDGLYEGLGFVEAGNMQGGDRPERILSKFALEYSRLDRNPCDYRVVHVPRSFLTSKFEVGEGLFHVYSPVEAQVQWEKSGAPRWWMTAEHDHPERISKDILEVDWE